MKTVLGPLENCAAKLAAIQPVYFEYKADSRRRRRIGLLAQECQVDFPEAVSIGPDSGMLGMAYSDLLPVLLQAQNETTARLEELTCRVAALEAPKTRKPRAR